MKLISINIELNRHYKTVLEFLKKEKPDVVCIQELLEEDVEMFKKELGLECIFKPFRYPTYQDILDKKMGNALFAKNIISSGYVFYNGKESVMSLTYEEYIAKNEAEKNSVLVWVKVKEANGIQYKFITTHLPVTMEGASTPHQLQVVDALLAELENHGEFVLCGDMNAPRGNETFTRLARKYKDNIPLEYKTSIDQNLHRVKGIQFMVDGLFTTPSYKAKNVKLVDGVSDHMAIVAEIEKNKEKEPFQDLINKDKYQVFLFHSRASIPFQNFSHPWFVINKKGEISRWEVMFRRVKHSTSWGHLYKDFFPPFLPIEIIPFYPKFHWSTKLLGQIEGEGAKEMAEFIENSPTNYKYCEKYLFLGPNSNTYAKWVLDNCPQFKTKLPKNSLGKNYKK